MRCGAFKELKGDPLNPSEARNLNPSEARNLNPSEAALEIALDAKQPASNARPGLVFKAHRRVYHSTVGLRGSGYSMRCGAFKELKGDPPF